MQYRAWSDMKKWEMMRWNQKTISKFEAGQTRSPLFVSLKVAVSVIILSTLPVPLGSVTRRGGSGDVAPALANNGSRSWSLSTHTG